jgi:hypothetical protein
MVGIRSPDGLVVGSCTSHPGVLGSIPKREEPGKTGAPCVKVPGSSRVPSTCPPLSSSPHAHSFVIGPAVIKHTLQESHTRADFRHQQRQYTLRCVVRPAPGLLPSSAPLPPLLNRPVEPGDQRSPGSSHMGHPPLKMKWTESLLSYVHLPLVLPLYPPLVTVMLFIFFRLFEGRDQGIP